MFKKIFISSFIFILLIGFVCFAMPGSIKAEDYYPMACAYYEVSYINDDGSFSKISCHDSFTDAQNEMNSLGGDHVVRSSSAYSPTKIISMVSGLAYSYPGRGDSATLNIYEHVSDRSAYYKRTYVSHYYEMQYYYTERVLKDGKRGMIKVNLNGFEGFTDLEYTDLVPSKYLDKNIPIWLGGNNSYYDEQPYQIILKRNTYSIKTNGNYKDLVYTYHLSYPKNSSINAIEYNINFGPAPSFMKEGDIYYSNDGINYYSDANLNNFIGEDYSYYQWLPLRSKTNIYAAQLETYMSLKGNNNSAMKGNANIFIEAQNNYGVNALLLYAMAIHESAFGTSNFALKRNNLFGWNAFDASPNSASSFSSLAQCVNEQAGINLRGYLDITDGRFFGSSLGNKAGGFNVKYASDPYWGMKIASYAYDIDKCANNYNGNLSDYNAYKLALITSFDTSIYAQANTSNELYKTGYGGDYQKHFLVIVLDNNGEFTEIQSTNAIKEGSILTHRTPITTGTVNPINNYNFNDSIAYIKTNDLRSLNYSIIEPTPTPTTTPKTYNPIVSLENASIDNKEIKLSGTALLEGADMSEKDQINFTILLKDYNDNKVYEFPAEVLENVNFSLNDGTDYKYSYYSSTINLASLPLSNYSLSIRIKNGDLVKEKLLKSSSVSKRYLSAKDNNYNYILYANTRYSYRLELNIIATPLDFTSINKPSARTSLVSFDLFELDNDLNFKMEGNAQIYYLDYPNNGNFNYNLYLVSDTNKYYKVNTNATACAYNFFKNYSNDYSGACYSISDNLTSLDTGEYDLVMEIKNGDYSDLLFVNNDYSFELPTISKDGKDCTFYTDESLKRIHLKIEEGD